jgi:hypothetical protein
VKAKREIIHTTDHNGRSIVMVPLANTDRYATVEAAEYASLREQKLSENWLFNSNGLRRKYVRCRGRGRKNCISVARVLCGAAAGQMVRYLDGDSTNLRRTNLTLCAGSRAVTRDAAVIDRKPVGCATVPSTSAAEARSFPHA